jgi:hypothetical protein
MRCVIKEDVGDSVNLAVPIDLVGDNAWTSGTSRISPVGVRPYVAVDLDSSTPQGSRSPDELLFENRLVIVL